MQRKDCVKLVIVLMAGVFGAALAETSAPTSLHQPGKGNKDNTINERREAFIMTLRTK
jgi:hypothetical protein